MGSPPDKLAQTAGEILTEIGVAPDENGGGTSEDSTQGHRRSADSALRRSRASRTSRPRRSSRKSASSGRSTSWLRDTVLRTCAASLCERAFGCGPTSRSIGR